MKSVNEKTIRALVEAGAVKNVLVVASGATVHVDIVTQNRSITATTNKGSIKTWATIDSSAKWLKGLGIGKAQLEISRWLPGQRGMSL
jgi:predicted aspartyl protease